jgi:hypothetical protein
MEKNSYRIIIALLSIYTVIDLVLMVLLLAKPTEFPQIVPFRWLIVLSLLLLIGLLSLSINQYRKKFSSKN